MGKKIKIDGKWYDESEFDDTRTWTKAKKSPRDNKIKDSAEDMLEEEVLRQSGV